MPTYYPHLSNPNFSSTRARRRDTRYIPLTVPSPLPLSPSTSTLTTHKRAGPNHTVQITPAPQRAASSTAIRVSADSDSYNTKRSRVWTRGRKDGEGSVYSTYSADGVPGERGRVTCEASVRDVAEVPDLCYSPQGSGSEGGSESETESWFDHDDGEDEEQDGEISPGTKAVPRKEKGKGKGKPVEVGWAHLRDEDGEVTRGTDVGGEGERKESTTTLFPRVSYVIPELPPKGSKKTKKKAEKLTDNQTAASSSMVRPKSKADFYSLYQNAKKIYAGGPRGEAHNVLESVQEHLEKKRLKKLEQERERTAAIEEAKRRMLEEQLADMHTAAQEYQAELQAARREPKRFSSLKSPPARPPPAEPLGIRRRVSIGGTGHRSLASNEAEGRQMSSGEKKRKNSETSEDTSGSIPIAASDSVKDDAVEVVIERSTPRVPRLDPGPRSGGKANSVGKGRVKRKEKPGPHWGMEPWYVKSRGHPSPCAPPVGSSRSPTTEAKSQWFAGLDGPSVQQSHQRPKHEKQDEKKRPDRDWLTNTLGAFFNVSTNPSSETLTDCAAPRKQEVFQATTAKARKQAQLKASISKPYAPSCPGGVTANFARESGGVGGPAAAISLPPGVKRKSELAKYNEWKSKGKGKEKAKRDSSHPQPRPLPPPLPPKISVPEPHRSGVEAKREKGGLLDLFTKHEVGGKYFHGFRKSDQSVDGSRKRADSDASFACQGIDYLEQRDVVRPDAATPAQPRGTGSSRVQPSRVQSTIRDPGPSRQRAPRKYVSEENVALIPPPLFTGGRAPEGNAWTVRELPGLDARNTRFYTLYDDLLSEYES